MRLQWLRTTNLSAVKSTVIVFLITVAFILVPSSYAQGTTPPTTNIQVANGPNPGEVVITWDAVPEAVYYRIGYINMDSDYPAASANGNWLEAFIYVDLANREQGSYTIKRLEQGAYHAFSVLTNSSHYAQPTWPSNPSWKYLTVQNRGCDCEVAEDQRLDTTDSGIGIQTIKLQSVSVGPGGLICGIRMNSSVICWGRNQRGQSLPPPGPFSSVSAGGEHTCRVRTDNSVACWGYYSSPTAPGRARSIELTPPSGQFLSVSAGYHHHCGVLLDRTLSCWGSNRIRDASYTGQSDPPSGKFKSITAGWFHTCGIRIDDTVACWGLNSGVDDSTRIGQATPPAGTFIKISAGADHTCGVRTDGTASCWGSTSSGAEIAPEGQFKDISAGSDITCWIKEDSTLRCHGDENHVGLDLIGDDTFKSISIGSTGICALAEDDALICRHNSQDFTAPSGVFTAIAPGSSHKCAIRDDNTLSCWGYDKHSAYGQTNPPAGRFQSIESGTSHTCGLLTNGMPVCWGNNDFGQASPPQNTFKIISAGRRHSCGIKPDNKAICWGSNKAKTLTCEETPSGITCDNIEDTYLVGQSNAPEGEFQDISAGGFHTCGVKIDGQLICWGSNQDSRGEQVGQATPPAGKFLSVSAGPYYTCAVREIGTAACWGKYGELQLSDVDLSKPPEGLFESVHTSTNYTCGLRPDDKLACWGHGIYFWKGGNRFWPYGSEQRLKSVSSGGTSICGILKDDSIVCSNGWMLYITPPK